MELQNGMQLQGYSTGGSEGRGAFALSVDLSQIIEKVGTVKEARALPRGSVIGDMHGGLTFTDAVAAALEARSAYGWQEVRSSSGDTWTIIVIDRQTAASMRHA
jgi:predicted Zn-dependent protease